MISCPRCSGEAYSEFYYNSGEEETSCLHCGYQYQGRYKRDEKGKLVTLDNSLDYRFDNLIWTERKTEPYACFHLKYKNSRGAHFGSLESEEAVDTFKADVEAKISEIARAFISRYDDATQEVSIEELVGSENSSKKM